MARTKKYRNATKDARGNYWAEYEDESGEKKRVAVKGPQEDFEDGSMYYAPYSEEDIGSNGGGYQQAIFGGDSYRWAPGSVISPEEYQAYASRLLDPRFTEGIEGLNAQNLYNDPRSAVRMENGQYIYRPDQMQGDFRAKNIGGSGFGNLLKGFLTSPGISLMASGIGLGSGLNALGLTGEAGLAGAAGAGGGMTPSQMQWLNNSLAGEAPFGGMNVMGAGEAAAGGAGELFGGSEMINSLMSPGMGASWAELTNTLGGAPLGAPGALAGAGGAAATGLQSVLQGGAQAGGSIWDKVLNIFSNPAGSLAKAAQGLVARPEDEEKNMKALGLGLNSIMEYFQSRDNQKQLQGDLSGSVQRADPFGEQRSFYQNLLKNSFSDPNFFNNDPTFQGVGRRTIDDLTRHYAALGFSQSPGNMLGEIGSRLQDERMKYALNFQNQLGSFAGAGINPSTAGQLQSTNAGMMNQGREQSNGAMGNLLTQLPGMLKGVGSAINWLS